jgi:hypothetical protein
MLRSLVTLTVLSLLSVFVSAQSASSGQKARVFISDSQSWETSGSAGGSNGTFAAHSHGGARRRLPKSSRPSGSVAPK